MKSLVLLLSLGLASVGLAQAPANRHSVSFEVKVLRSGASTDLSQGGSAYSGTTQTTTTTTMKRQKASQLALEVNLRNFAPRPDEITVEWFFFAQDVKDSTLILLSEGSKPVAFKPGGMEKVEAVSEAAMSSESKRTAIETTRMTQTRTDITVDNERRKEGMKVAGWLVRTRADGVTLGFKTSSPRFDQYADDQVRGALPKGNDARGGGK